MEPEEKKVSVILASDKYERQDIETAVNEAYYDNYIVDEIIREDNYIFIYFKKYQASSSA